MDHPSSTLVPLHPAPHPRWIHKLANRIPRPGYLFGNDKGYQWGPPGEPICGGGDIQLKATSDAAVPDEQFFIFCDYAFTRPGSDALPTTFAGRSADLSAYPGTPLMGVTTNQDGDEVYIVEGNGPNTLKHYLDDLSMTMLHEMLHFYVQGTSSSHLLIHT